eukprot:TRINITY_DN96027_c0_g1_i1.p1 TRINITY_DN96027_c0_g1~~TRINITY_DN96027_c0_g1_i1.p1  ORF type:complete len:327 (+),score=39.92 TRINITY_DN96027_c0_g1_i1:95-982(+)
MEGLTRLSFLLSWYARSKSNFEGSCSYRGEANHFKNCFAVLVSKTKLSAEVLTVLNIPTFSPTELAAASSPQSPHYGSLQSLHIVWFDREKFDYRASKLLITPWYYEHLGQYNVRLFNPLYYTTPAKPALTSLLELMETKVPVIQDKTKRNLVVWVSRKAKRRVIGENAVIDKLKTLLATPECGALELVVHSSDQLPPYKDQVALFRRARAVLGPHGAGLVNALWMPKGGVLLEFLDKLEFYHFETSYQVLATLLGHTYWVITDLPYNRQVDAWDVTLKGQDAIIQTARAAICGP